MLLGGLCKPFDLAWSFVFNTTDGVPTHFYDVRFRFERLFIVGTYRTDKRGKI